MGGPFSTVLVMILVAMLAVAVFVTPFVMLWTMWRENSKDGLGYIIFIPWALAGIAVVADAAYNSW